MLAVADAICAHFSVRCDVEVIHQSPTLLVRYCRKPRLLILDEAMNALDMASEREIIRRLSRAPSASDHIMIAHRVESVRLCQRRVRLEAGRFQKRSNCSSFRTRESAANDERCASHWRCSRSAAVEYTYFEATTERVGRTMATLGRYPEDQMRSLLVLAPVAVANTAASANQPWTGPGQSALRHRHQRRRSCAMGHSHGLHGILGTFPGATGTLVIDPKQIARATLDVTVPIVSETNQPRTHGELFSDDFSR